MAKNSDVLEEYLGMLKNNTREDILKRMKGSNEEIKSAEDLYKPSPEKNLIESTHDEVVVYSPSYDRFHGMIPNGQQAQSISINKLNQKNKGGLGSIMNTRYATAKHNLLMSLIKVSNYLDNTNNENLRKVSDACIEDLSNSKLKKNAQFDPFTVSLVAIPIVLGLLWWQQHSDFANEGFLKNTDKLNAELDDFLGSDSYDQKIVTYLADFKNKTENLKMLFNDLSDDMYNVKHPKNLSDLNEIMETLDVNTVANKFKQFKESVKNMKVMINSIKANFSNNEYKHTMRNNPNIFQSTWDFVDSHIGGVLYGGKGLISDDFDDVLRALPPYEKSIEDVYNMLIKTTNVSSKIEQKLKNFEESKKNVV